MKYRSVILQFVVPISQILLQIDLLGSPEARLSLLVHPPDVVILDGQDHKAVGVIFQQWFLTKIHSHLTTRDVFLSSLGLLGPAGGLLLIFFGVREGDGKVLNAGESHFDLLKLE